MSPNPSPRRTRALIGVSAAVATLATGVAAPAFADSGTTSPTTGTTRSGSTEAPCLHTVQAWTAHAVNRREATITRLTDRVKANQHLSASDSSALLGTLSADGPALTQIGQTVTADTTCTQARTDAKTILTGYRIYAVVVPQVHLVLAADNGLYAVSRLQDSVPTLQKAIADEQAAGKDVSAAQTALTDLQAQISAASQAFTAAAPAALALTPADWNANHDITAPVRDQVKTGRTALRAGLKDLHTATQVLLGNI